MKRLRFLRIVMTVLLASSFLAGCGHKEGDKHDHAKEKTGEEGHGHDGGAESGASFKAGSGIILTEETRKILGVEVIDVTEQKLPKEVRFSVQVFGEKHHHDLVSQDHSGCDVHGSALVSSQDAAVVKAGLPVQILKTTNALVNGVVLSVQKALALGESEIIIGVSNAATVLKPGEFVSASITLPREEFVAVVPDSAVLRTAEGTFVYAVNGRAYLRTAVTLGSQANGLVEITDGLLAGDQIVTKPVETLWLIELRATKGGGHSH
jgi:hypothetical protein